MTGFVDGCRSTIRSIASDHAALTVLVATGIVYSFFYPAPYRAEVASRFPIALVDLDRSPMSRAIARRMLGVRAVRLDASVSSVNEAKALVDAGKAEGVALIAADFQRDILRGGQGEVALFGNGAHLSHGGTALSGLAEAVSAFGAEAAAAQARFAGVPVGAPFRLVPRPMFNTREGYGSALVPAVSGVIVHQVLLIGIGLLAATRRERGGRPALTMLELLGVVAAFWGIGVVNLLYFSGFVFWYQDYPRGGNLVGLAIAGGLFIAATVSLGLLVGSFFTARERALQVIAATSLPMFFLANVSWPKPATPPLLTWLATLLPTTPGITAMIKFNQMGAQLAEAVPELLNLASLVLLYGGLAAWRYRAAATTHYGNGATQPTESAPSGGRQTASPIREILAVIGSRGHRPGRTESIAARRFQGEAQRFNRTGTDSPIVASQRGMTDPHGALSVEDLYGDDMATRETTFIRYSPGVETVGVDFEAHLATVLEGVERFIAGSVTTGKVGRAVRFAHAKGYGLVRGQFEILRGLDPEYAQGIYATPGTHDALVRFSNGSAHLGADAALPGATGLALKIFDIAGPTLLEDEPHSRTFDYNAINAPIFFCNTAAHYLFIAELFTEAQSYFAQGTAGAHRFYSAYLTGKGTLPQDEWAWDELLAFLTIAKLPPVNLLLATHWTMGAVRHGDYIAKVRFAPSPASAAAVVHRVVDKSTGADAYAAALTAELKARPYAFDVQVQLCTNLDRMPVHDLTVEWPEALSPFVTVATLRFPPQDINRPETIEAMDALSFTPWRVTAEHAPLGDIQRVRKEVYRRSSLVRHRLNHQARQEPSHIADVLRQVT